MVIIRFIPVKTIEIKGPFRQISNVSCKADVSRDKVFGIVKKLEDIAAFGKKRNLGIKRMIVIRVNRSVPVIE